jgi:uncharacterized SAM-binding protein YcdF (DUF218 family)
MIDADYAPVLKPANTVQPKRKRGLFSRWRLLRMFALLIVLMMVAGFFAFTAHVSGMLQPATISKADAIVVLTGGQDRLPPAINLLLNGAAKKLLIAGVNPDTPKRDIMSAYAVPSGIAECCIDLDQVSKNTIGNAQETVKWLRANGFNSVILVTSNYHMPRASSELQYLANDVTVIDYPLVVSDLSLGKWAERPDAARLLIMEYLKFCHVSVRHWVTRLIGT